MESADGILDGPAKIGVRYSRHLTGRWHLLPLLAGAVAFLIWAWATDWFVPIVAEDLSQLRANVVLPAPRATTQARQTFVSRRAGLTEVEILIARSGEATGSGRLEMQLLDGAGRTIASRSLETNRLAHNQPLSLAIPAQADSAGREYTLLIGGSANNDVTLWGYDLDVYEDGQLTLIGGESAAQELRFITRYHLTLTAAMAVLGDAAGSDGPLLLLSLALMLLPGCLLLGVAGRRFPHIDPAAWLGLALALGVSLWPVTWLWLSLISGRWRAWSLWLVLFLGWALVFWLLARSRWRAAKEQATQPAVKRKASRLGWHHAVLLLVLLLSLAVRLLAVRDLAFPPWVDSSRHALITAVMRDSGQAIRDYQPYLEIDRFPYHFGFHTLSAGLAQMSGEPLPGLLLTLGQLINALVPLTAYAAVYLLVRQRGPALLAAFLLALPFFFPGYYVTWGRLTQLTAMLVLPALLAVTWLLARGARGWRQIWWLAAVLAAGLFLIHIRVLVYTLPLVALIWLVSYGRHSKGLVGAAGLGLLLVLPHFARLASYAYARSRSPSQQIADYNAFPFGYAAVGWEQTIWLLAGLSLLLAAVAAFRRKSWAWLPLVLGAWMGLVALLLSGSRFGLPESNLINLNSAYIVAFLPLAIILAVAAGRIWRWSGHWWPARAGFALLGGALLAAALLMGLRQQITILNPATILAHAQDGDGITWLAENVEEPAKVAVSSWLWLGSAWAGSDGGAWIVPLTGIETTTPPVDYVYSPDLISAVDAFNQEAATWQDWSQPRAAGWLREQGVSHVFVGARGGFIDPAELARNPELRLVYSRDGVFIFTTRP